MKRCPYCDEEIRENAIKCKHCSSMLTNNNRIAFNSVVPFGRQKDFIKYDTLDAAATQGKEATILAGQYRILKKTGEGGMGVIYLAEDMELGNRKVAIKVLPPLLSKNIRAVENLRREALTAINLNHPNIIRLYGFHSDGDIKFLAMEYIDGQTLDDKLARSPDSKLNLDETVAIVEKVALALDYAHSRKNPVFHLDLKPSNIMINSYGEIKLLDFGIAREMHDSYTRVTGKQDTSGTLPYMSPEQLQGQRPSAAMDIYALGAVCYECLSGHPPFYTGELTYQIINKEPASIYGIAEHVNNILKLALAKDCLNRPKTAKNLIELLKGQPQYSEVIIAKDNNKRKINQEKLVEGERKIKQEKRIEEERKIQQKKRIEKAIEAGRPFGFVEKLAIDSFTCSFCGCDIDKSAIVLEDKNGKEILVGESCAQLAGVKMSKNKPENVLKRKQVAISEKDMVWPVAVSPFNAVKAKEYQKQTAEALNVTVEKTVYLGGNVKMKFVLIPAGEFDMGSPSDEKGRLEDEGPVHKVKIRKPFFMSKFPITQEQYEIITGNNPSDLIGPNLPVESVLWEEAVEFCTKLIHRKGKLFRLSTEAEWEYACRAGTTTPFNTGETISTNHANYNGNYIYGNGRIGVYRKKAIDVGSLIPNAFGLYDMHGNVWEWCSDWYDENYYASSPIIDPEGPSSGICRILRGGTWSMYPSVCRSARRHRFSPSGRYSLYGFRVVLALD